VLTLSGSREACKDCAVRMLEKKATDLGIVLGNLSQQRRELAEQSEHQAGLGPSSDGVRLKLRLMEPFPECLGSLVGGRMVVLPQKLGDGVQGSLLGNIKGRICLQERDRKRLLQLGKQVERHRIIGFEAGGKLIDQPGLALNEPVLVASECFEFLYQWAIGSQSPQIGQITAAGLGQQRGIYRIGLRSRGLAAPVHRLGIDGIDGKPCVQERGDEQATERRSAVSASAVRPRAWSTTPLLFQALVLVGSSVVARSKEASASS
jgi:hypothetical protein